MNILYYDCFAGISGDMNLGALIDLGVDAGYLKNELEKLNIKGFRLEVEQDQRKGITGTKATIIIENPDNEKHRHLRHVTELVNNSTLSDNVKTKALKIFNLIAEAEAKIHNISKEKVHFHEVGALDSIADIVGAAICLDYLNPDKILSSPVQLGGGTVKCAHGIMPVPAPATAEILKNIPVRKGLVNHEATTPTGAAILAATVDEFIDATDFSIVKTAYGIGQRDSSMPNVLRVYLCRTDAKIQDIQTSMATVMEANIDDMNPEHYDFVIQKLLDAKADDVWLTPIIMKKNRPAMTLSVLCSKSVKNILKEIIFIHTSSIGIREYKVAKNMLARKQFDVDTIYGKVSVKQSLFKGKAVSTKPEYEHCKALAEQHNISIKEIENAVLKSL